MSVWGCEDCGNVCRREERFGPFNVGLITCGSRLKDRGGLEGEDGPELIRGKIDARGETESGTMTAMCGPFDVSHDLCSERCPQKVRIDSDLDDSEKTFAGK